jgi:ABC-type antimicrobial peptide transport system permease subunit
MAALARRIDDDPRFALAAQAETDYYAAQAESANALYILVVGIAVLAGIGAGFGAANTMYAAVQARTAEIGTLRAMGFPRGAILWAFQVEALALSGLGFAIGAVLAVLLARLIALLLGGIAFGARTFTTNVITLQVAPADLAAALVLALGIGVAGGFGPAWRAARLRPIEALRKAAKRPPGGSLPPAQRRDTERWRQGRPLNSRRRSLNGVRETHREHSM